jgi:hypothetical protein
LLALELVDLLLLSELFQILLESGTNQAINN